MCLSPRPANKAELLEMADQEKISLAVSQQVDLVGSQSLYDKINKNFKEGGFDAIFAKVHFLFYFCHWSIFRILGVRLIALSIGMLWALEWKQNINLWIFLNQEHFELYRWRKDYFYSQFGYAGQFDRVNWFTTGGDDAHDFDTVPYQVCRT